MICPINLIIPQLVQMSNKNKRLNSWVPFTLHHRNARRNSRNWKLHSLPFIVLKNNLNPFSKTFFAWNWKKLCSTLSLNPFVQLDSEFCLWETADKKNCFWIPKINLQKQSSELLLRLPWRQHHCGGRYPIVRAGQSQGKLTMLRG